MRRTLLITSAVALAAAAASVGFTQTSNRSPQLDDATIVAIFDAANTADIETGTLAVQRAQRANVREYAEMLARDHKAVRQLGRDLAGKLNVTPTPPADSSSAVRHRTAMKQLRSVPAANFDRAFLEHEIAFHQAVIEAMNSTLLPAIQNGELKALVLKVVPAFDAHRLAAEHLLEKGSSK